MAALVAALIAVESGGDNNAAGDHGKALGCLQIHASYMADVNRISGSNYRHKDAHTRAVAVWATIKYLRHYGRAYERQTGRKATYEVLARIHNGGPRGWEKPTTRKYWNKVRMDVRHGAT